MADVASITGNNEYIEALNRLWENVVLKNMYITGGIGPSKDNEGFTQDYDLPNETAYCETCASVGMVLWNHRMNLLHGDRKYADIVERAMYNGALAGVSLSGDRFFYVNPLASDGTHHRQEWYDCSCCPTQIARFIPSIGNYVYNISKEGIWVNLYIASESNIEFLGGNAKLTQFTDYPWDGRIDIAVDTSITDSFEINLRFPGWCKSASFFVNGQKVINPVMDKGYVKIKRQWLKGDKISIDFQMPVEKVYAHPGVKADAGKVAVQRGPIVYCMEEADNPIDIQNIHLTADTKFIVEYREDILGGVNVIKAMQPEGEKYTFVPYYAWDNRKPGWMTVWLDEKKPEEPSSLYSV